MQIDLNNSLEIQVIGMNALKAALGPIGAIRFMQQHNMGYGDYTKERQEQPDVDFDEAIAEIKKNASVQ